MKLRLPGFRKAAIALLICLLAVVLAACAAVSLVLSSESGSRWALNQVVSQLNGLLPDQQISLGGTSGALAGGLRLNQLQYGNASVRVSVAQVDLDWNPLALLSKQVSIPEVIFHDTVVELLPGEPEPTPAPASSGPLIAFSPLPVTLNVGRVAFEQATIRQPEQEFRITSLSSSVELQGLDLDVTDLALDAEIAALSGDVALVLRDFLPVNATLDWQYKEAIYPQSPPVSGTLSLEGDLQSLAINHQLTQPVALSSSGSINLGVGGGDLAIDLVHDSQSLVLPPELTGTDISLNDFSATTRGGLDLLQFSLTTSLESDLAPPARISIDASWRNSQLQISSYQLATDSGGLEGSAVVNLENGVTGSLQYQLADATPLAYLEATLGSEPPFEILDLRSDGNLTFALVDGSTQASLSIASLTGEFGTYPFKGNAQLAYQDGSLLVDELNLATTDNRLQVTGTLADNLDFRWEVDAPRLDQFVPDLGGRLNASGEITGTPADPQVVASLDLASARYAGVGIDSLSLELARRDGDLLGELSVTAATFSSGERVDQLDSLDLQLAGTEADHRISLSARSSYANLELALQGGLSDPPALAWQGALTSGHLDTPLGPWDTDAATGISASSEAVDVDDSCWRQNNASVCLNFSRSGGADSSLQAAGRIRDYPLAIVNHPDNLPEVLRFESVALPRLPENIRVGGVVDADLLLSLDQAAALALNAQLRPRDVALTIRAPVTEDTPEELPQEIPEQTYLLVGPQLSASLAEGDWTLLANAEIGRLERADDSVSIGGSFETRMSLSQSGVLEGDTSASMEDLGWFSAMLPEVSGLEGNLAASLGIGGSLDEPQLDMDVQLADGQVTVPPLGITVTAISSRLRSQGNELIELSASAGSDAGSLLLQGQVSDPFVSRRQFQARLSGTDFRLAGTPDLGLTISPDIQVSASGELIQVSGELQIPLLNVTLRELPEQAVDVSRDAVVVDYPPGQPQLANSIATEQGTLFNVPVVADVNIVLGDNVSLNGFGFSSQVAGNLNIRQQENGTSLTYGELVIVRGDYSMYGQSLQIRGGKLLFFGPMDNPALDLRATRTVDNITVGVLMNGTLKNIRSQLFSTPALPDSDIIAIMATGKPFSEIGQGEQDRDAVLGSIARLGLSRSQGLTNQVREQLGLDALAITNTGSINNTSLTVGKYLTPDIFIRYGIGLFDHQSKLALDYTLTERVTLQAETGEYQSVDVIYRVER